jgi:cytochrome o ubiquinol oxidase operon protein cyoD
MKAIYTYVFGFVLSLALTVVAFALVAAHVSSGHEFISHDLAMGVLSALAVVQLVAQLMLFLHVGEEEKPRFNLMALCFALITVTILVGGTLWIMYNLSHGAHDATHNVFKDENIPPSTYAH